MLMEGTFHGGAHVLNLNMCSRTETHSVLSFDVHVRCTT